MDFMVKNYIQKSKNYTVDTPILINPQNFKTLKISIYMISRVHTLDDIVKSIYFYFIDSFVMNFKCFLLVHCMLYT